MKWRAGCPEMCMSWFGGGPTVALENRDHVAYPTECILCFVQEIISDENPQQKLYDLAEILEKEVIKLNPSSKHMANRELGRLEPIKSLKYRKAI